MKVYLVAARARRDPSTGYIGGSCHSFVIVYTGSSKSFGVQTRMFVHRLIGHAFSKEFQLALELSWRICSDEGTGERALQTSVIRSRLHVPRAEIFRYKFLSRRARGRKERAGSMIVQDALCSIAGLITSAGRVACGLYKFAVPPAASRAWLNLNV